MVDDERAVRESLRRALELEGYEIALADDGLAALEALEESDEPDAMILDVLMPGLDGLEVARRVRRVGRFVVGRGVAAQCPRRCRRPGQKHGHGASLS